MKTNIHFLSYLAHFFLQWKMFQIKVIKKIKTHILCSVIFIFRKLCRLWDNVGKYCRVGQATDGNMAHEHCMLDTQGYKYTHSGCVIPIVFPLQQWSHARAFLLRHMYIDWLLHDSKSSRAAEKSPYEGSLLSSSLVTVWKPLWMKYGKWNEAGICLLRRCPRRREK
jgi:hypothetical protein